MRIAEAFAAVKDGRAEAVRRRCWHKSMQCVAEVDAPHHIYLFNTTQQVAYPYWPHSVDVRADDWMVVAVSVA